MAALDWTVAIPTYRRAETLATKTLPTLHAAGVPAEKIDVYLSDPGERDTYTTALPADLYGRLLDGRPTLAANRNHIMASARPGDRIVFADDDLSGISRRVTEKELRPVTDLPREIGEAFTAADHVGAHLWGIYPVHNAFFMKPKVRYDLRYIIGCFYGVTVRGEPCEMVDLEDKEDYERTLRFYSRDGALVRLEYLAPNTRYYRERGGMQETRTEARVTASARALAERFPDLATYYVAKSGHAELRLKDRRPAAEGAR